MKGPNERLKYDLRRVWECPVCHHRCRTDGTTNVLWCDCTLNAQDRPTVMRLVEDGIRRRLPVPPKA